MMTVDATLFWTGPTGEEATRRLQKGFCIVYTEDRTDKLLKIGQRKLNGKETLFLNPRPWYLPKKVWQKIQKSVITVKSIKKY